MAGPAQAVAVPQGPRPSKPREGGVGRSRAGPRAGADTRLHLSLRRSDEDSPSKGVRGPQHEGTPTPRGRGRVASAFRRPHPAPVLAAFACTWARTVFGLQSCWASKHHVLLGPGWEGMTMKTVGAMQAWGQLPLRRTWESTASTLAERHKLLTARSLGIPCGPVLSGTRGRSITASGGQSGCTSCLLRDCQVLFPFRLFTW